MIKERILKNPVISFVALSFIIFLLFLMVIGIAMVLGAPEILNHILKTISAWSSTFALIIIYKKVYPGLKFWDFVKKQFSTRIKISVLGIVVMIQIIIFAVTIFLLNGKNDINFTLSVSGMSMFLFLFFDNLLSGPLGEELGWRGYALNELQKKHSPLMSALVVGFLWGLWHTPLWFLSGYTGFYLIKYSFFFMIGIISITVIMTLFYNFNKNLIIPIIIHQLFNFSCSIINVELIYFLFYTSTFYFFVAIILVSINPKRILYKK